MYVKLDKNDLINLVTSTSPSYEDMGKFEKSKLGRYCGGFNDRWDWDRSELRKMSDEGLLDLYSYLRDKLYEYVRDKEE